MGRSSKVLMEIVFIVAVTRLDLTETDVYKEDGSLGICSTIEAFKTFSIFSTASTSMKLIVFSIFNNAARRFSLYLTCSSYQGHHFLYFAVLFVALKFWLFSMT